MSSTPPGPNYSWQPQPGNFTSAPPYGRPPKKSRAGLIIVLIVLLIVVAVGAIGVLAYRLVADHQDSKSGPAPSTSVAPPPATRSTRTVPSKPAPTTPAKPTSAPTTTATSPVTTAADLGRRFVAQLNANSSKGAAAYACKGSEQLIPLLMRSLLGPPTKLTAGAPLGQAPSFVIPLSGTSKGATVSGTLLIQKLGPDPMCVQVFTITTRTTSG
ncbi:hypothetical protein ACIA58_06385 [Kribbella sp. NPDC051586]|uniref:hypothetical protein n=1 Tax=Kribbella sp. NPDC051586 TaxID=3364118 RepID=UPI0037A73F39